MKATAYLLGLGCALPLAGFSLGVLAFGRSGEVGSMLQWWAEFSVALVWGLPALGLAVLALAACAFRPRARPIGSALVIGLNLAAVIVVLHATGWPRTVSQAAMLGPSVVSCWLMARAGRP